MRSWRPVRSSSSPWWPSRARRKPPAFPSPSRAAASSSTVTGHLKGHGIYDLFDAVVTCEDVENGKPAPDLYLLAAKRLGVDPTRCTAYEDAELGMQSRARLGWLWWTCAGWRGYPTDDYKAT